jgi:hypothetical protein
MLGLALALVAGCERRPPLSVGLPPSEPAGEISQLIASDLNTNFDISTQQFASTTELISALRLGQIDIAIIEEPATPSMDIKVLRPLFPSVLHVLVKPDILRQPADKLDIFNLVKGQKVFAGQPGSAGHSLVNMLVSQRVFPAQSEFTLLDSVFGPEPDIIVVFGGIMEQTAQQRLNEYRLISLGSIDNFGRGSWAEGVALRSPNIQPFIVPEGLYPALSDQPTVSLAVRSLLVTHPQLDDEIAYTIMQRTGNLTAQMRSIYPLAGQQLHDSGRELSLNLNTHPGAIRYLQREAPGFFERYAELFALLITVIVAASSLLIALLRVRNKAKKDRIDIYFDELLNLRDALTNSTLGGQEAFDKVLELQSKVTRLVSDERIAADSSFVGFITLSNQVLQECGASHRFK